MRRLMWLAAFGTGALAPAVSAQESPRRFALGIGVALNPVALLVSANGLNDLVVPIGLGNVTVPMSIGARVRLEPEFGLTRYSSETNVDTADFNAQTAVTALRLGVGLSIVVLEEAGLRTYAGFRVGLSRFSESSSQTSPFGDFEGSLKRTDSHIGVMFGGEYFLARRFSLGAELQLTRVSFGETQVESAPVTPSFPSPTTSLWSTNGLVAFRFYVI